MPDPLFAACHGERVLGLTVQMTGFDGRFVCKLRAVAGQDAQDGIGHRVAEGCEEVGAVIGVGHRIEFCECELAGPVEGEKHVCLAVSRPDIRGVDVETSDPVVFRDLRRFAVPLHIREAADPVSLIQPVEPGTAKMRHHELQGVQAVVERQQGVNPEADTRAFLFGRQFSVPGAVGTHRQVVGRRP